MSTFNSLGSNYDFSFALRALVAMGDSGNELMAYLEQRYGGKATLTAKGRGALVLALKALIGEKRDAKVAINGFTCIALYDAVVEVGATPVYLDIEEGALDFSVATLKSALERDSSIKAVVLQNTLGFPCAGPGIAAVCKERDVALIEDLAHSIGARYTSGQEVGTLGDAVILSFSQDKVVDAVSGGAVVMRNTARVAIPTIRVSSERQAKERWYPLLTWKIRTFYSIGIGKWLHALYRTLYLLPRPLDSQKEPARMPGWQAGLVLLQFDELERVSAHRKRIVEIYAHALPSSTFLQVPTKSISRAANLRFPIVVPDRAALVAHLATGGIYVSDTWYDAPIAPQKYMSRTSYKTGMCPHADNVSDHVVNLPTHINVSTGEAERIAHEVNRFFAHVYH